MIRLALLMIVLGLATPALAADALPSDTQNSLQKTQDMLRNRGSRAEAIKGNKAAETNDQELQKLMGSQQGVDGVYGLSADILGTMVNDTKGDPAALQKKLEEAQKNPQAFFNSLTPEQRKMIEGLANQSEASRAPTSKP